MAPTIKKSNWLFGCFQLDTTHKKQAADQPTLDGRRRRGIRLVCRSPVRFRMMKKPWSKRKQHKVVEESSLKVVQFSEAESQTFAKLLLIDQTTVSETDKFDHPAKDSISKCLKQPGSDTPNSIKYGSESERTEPPREKPGSQESKGEIPTGPTRNSTKRSRVKKMQRAEGDTFAGISILIVTLMITLLCGRVCAILCASIWLYCIPRLTKRTKNDGVQVAQRKESDLSSDPYRKKVIMQGFLERKRNTSPSGPGFSYNLQDDAKLVSYH